MLKVIVRPSVQMFNVDSGKWSKVEFDTTVEAHNYYIKMRRLGQFSAKLHYGKAAYTEAVA